MTGNEELKAARAEIEEILKRRNIGGYVVLHMPGFCENFGHYTPSYSVLKPEYDADGFMSIMRVQSKLSNYNGDVEAQKRDLNATAGMLHAFIMMLGQDAISFHTVAKSVEGLLRVTHTPFTAVRNPYPTKGQ